MTETIGLKVSAAEEAELWRRYRAGQNCSEIARALGKPYSLIRGRVERQGGFAPRPQRRNARVLSLSEREEISRGLCAQQSLRQIAARLGRAASSVSREIRRHGGVEGYRALPADAEAWRRARRPKACVLSRHERLRTAVVRMLQQKWSPRQIAQRLSLEFPDDHSMRVSHETLYRTLFIQARGALKQELLEHLRSGRAMRRGRTASAKGKGQGQIVGAVSIRERPAEAEDRAVPGHWEGDLLAGSKNSRIITLVERSTRYVMLAKLPDRTSATTPRDARLPYARRENDRKCCVDRLTRQDVFDGALHGRIHGRLRKRGTGPEPQRYQTRESLFARGCAYPGMDSRRFRTSEPQHDQTSAALPSEARSRVDSTVSREWAG